MRNEIITLVIRREVKNMAPEKELGGRDIPRILKWRSLPFLASEELYLAVNALMRAGIELRAREETDDEDAELLGFIAASLKAKRLALEIARV